MADIWLKDTLWDKKWFRVLSLKHKTLLIYLWNNCSRWGIIDIDLDLFSFRINEEIVEEDILFLSDRITITNDNKYYLNGYIYTQQSVTTFNELNPINKSHIKLIAQVERLRLDMYENEPNFSLELMKTPKERSSRNKKPTKEEIKRRADENNKILAERRQYG